MSEHICQIELHFQQQLAYLDIYGHFTVIETKPWKLSWQFQNKNRTKIVQRKKNENFAF